METTNYRIDYNEVEIILTSNRDAYRVKIRVCDLVHVLWFLYDKQMIIASLTTWEMLNRRVTIRALQHTYDNALRYIARYAI